jgi:hypothetical protein
MSRFPCDGVATATLTGILEHFPTDLNYLPNEKGRAMRGPNHFASMKFSLGGL